jgi:hypothetical protein
MLQPVSLPHRGRGSNLGFDTDTHKQLSVGLFSRHALILFQKSGCLLQCEIVRYSPV